LVLFLFRNGAVPEEGVFGGAADAGAAAEPDAGRRGSSAPAGPLSALVARSTLKNLLLEPQHLDYHSLLSELATLAAPTNEFTNNNFINNNR